ncbi:hypothetical protein D3C83_299190 [compost metagenome]
MVVAEHAVVDVATIVRMSNAGRAEEKAEDESVRESHKTSEAMIGFITQGPL